MRTVLIACALLLPAFAAAAEEHPSLLSTAVGGTSLSGYVDTSAHWNPGTGNRFIPLYRFNSPSKADGFNLNVVQLRLDRPLDETQWAAGYRVDLWAGPDANALGTQSVFGQSEHAAAGDFAIRQAYVALRVPVFNGLDLKAGVFDSIIGYESIEAPLNPNYTRSYGHSIEPQTHTGLLASYRFNEIVSASLGIANTFGPIINSRAFSPVAPIDPPRGSNVRSHAESYKTYLALITLTAPDNCGFFSGSTLYGGVVNGFNNHVLGFRDTALPTTSAYVGATINTPLTGLRLGTAWDLLTMDSKFNAFPDGHIRMVAHVWSIAGYASWQATEKLSLHARVEYVTGDIDEPFFREFYWFGKKNGMWSGTATVQYDLWKNVLTRLEFRWDNIEHGKAFSGGAYGPTSANAYLLAANVIYKF